MLRAYFGRFFVAGLIVVAVFIPWFLASSVLLYDRSHTAWTVSLVAMGILTDLALTFVTPALTFTTSSPRTAYAIGLRMIRSAWPACALYVLLPPLALQVLLGLSRALDPARAAALCVSVLLALACKGATVRFYVRRAGVMDPTWLGRQPADGSLPPPPETA